MSYLLKTLAAVSVVALAACQDVAMDEPTAVSPFIGKQLVAENGTVFTFDGSGNVGGTFRGEAIVGEYEASATEICSTYSAPAPLVGSEFCSTPVINGDTVIFNRRDGSSSQVYTIQG